MKEYHDVMTSPTTCPPSQTPTPTCQSTETPSATVSPTPSLDATPSSTPSSTVTPVNEATPTTNIVVTPQNTQIIGNSSPSSTTTAITITPTQTPIKLPDTGDSISVLLWGSMGIVSVFVSAFVKRFR